MDSGDRTIAAFTKAGRPIFIRALRSTDKLLIEELFRSLSPRSIFFRFHGNLTSLHPNVIGCVMKLDYTKDLALVALERNEPEGAIIGLCGIRRQTNSETGEFTVVVRDEWQGIGVGARLTEISLPMARDLGMKRIWGIISPENTTMAEMATDLGFTVRRDQKSGYYEMELIF